MAKLYYYYSTMNAGKSTALLQAAYNYSERGMNTMLFTALLDNRAQGRLPRVLASKLMQEGSHLQLIFGTNAHLRSLTVF